MDWTAFNHININGMYYVVYEKNGIEMKTYANMTFQAAVNYAREVDGRIELFK